MIVAQREMLRLAQGELTVSRLEIERYKLMLAKARREQYGQSSERARHLAHDAAMGPKTPHSTVLSGEEEAMVIAFEEFLRPAIIEVLDDALATAKFGNAVFAAQAFQHDPDLVFRRKVSPCRATDVLDDLRRRLFLRSRLLSDLRSSRGLR
jgi:hypothetical protein